MGNELGPEYGIKVISAAYMKLTKTFGVPCNQEVTAYVIMTMCVLPGTDVTQDVAKCTELT